MRRHPTPVPARRSRRSKPLPPPPYPQFDPRFKRLLMMWRRYGEFCDERIPKGLTRVEFWQLHVNQVVDIARLVKADGWSPRLRGLSRNDASKSRAIDIFVRAMDEDRTAVAEMLQDRGGHLFFGLSVDKWLCEGLMYEVLGRYARPSLHWDGKVCTPKQ